MTLIAQFEASAGRWPDRTAVVDPSGEVRVGLLRTLHKMEGIPVRLKAEDSAGIAHSVCRRESQDPHTDSHVPHTVTRLNMHAGKVEQVAERPGA